MKLLYQYKISEHLNECEEINIRCSIYTPSAKRKYRLPSEKISLKTTLVRFMFSLLTFGRMKIFYVTDNDKIIHTSYVVPKCLKFNFLNKNDYAIGPCFTYPEYRGKGIYPNMLKVICQSCKNKDTVFYMVVDEKNISSIKGIEKAGFVRCGYVKVSPLIKRYCPVKSK